MTEAAIAALEDARYAAMLAGDVAALEGLLHPALRYIHSNGLIDSRDSYLAGFRSGLWQYQTIGRSDQEIVVTGATALVINRLAISILVGGEARAIQSRALAVWAREGGTWRLTALQSVLA